MSAWIVSREHIDVLVKARLVHARQYWTSDCDPDETGRMLWRENLRSLTARYPDDEDGGRPGPVDFSDADVDEYTYRDPGFIPTPGEIFQTIGCYDYQSCEHDGWDDSEAKAWTENLRDVVAGTLYDGPWGWDAENVAARKGLVPA